MKKRLRGISAGILLSVCLGFLLGVYAPLELYLPNQSEFWPSLGQLIGPMLLFFFGITVFGCALFIGLRLVGKLPYYIALLLGFGALVSLYIQGNFLTGGLPPFDGTIYDWSAASPERIKSIAAWVLPIAALLVAFLKCKRKLFRKIITYGSGAVLLILVLTLTSLLLTTPTKEDGTYLTSTSQNAMQLSKDDTNLVVILLDAVDSDYFLQAIGRYPEFSDSFDDFTYYSDALAAYPFTLHSIPMILTGQWHENDQPYAQYAENAYSTSPLLNRLTEDGYQMGIYSSLENMFTTKTFKGRFDNQLAATPEFTSFIDSCKQVGKMAGIKYAPWDLKRYCYDILASLDYVKVIPNSMANAFDSYLPNWYITSTWENPLTLVEEPCFRFIHTSGAHIPFIYNKECSPISDATSTYQDPVEACVTFADSYIKMLKKQGVYDNTILIFMADHGYDPTGENLLNRFHPLFMVKGLGETGEEMVIDDTPVSHEHVMQAMLNLLDGVPSGDIFDPYISDSRRLILYNYTEEHMMQEYTTTGHASDLNSKKATGNEYICQPYN